MTDRRTQLPLLSRLGFAFDAAVVSACVGWTVAHPEPFWIGWCVFCTLMFAAVTARRYGHG